MSNSWAAILNGCLEIAQPLLARHCLLCGAASGKDALCAPCHADLPWHRAPHCPCCALPTPLGATCGACLQKQPFFDRTLAAFSYDFPVDALIQQLKYAHRLAIAPVLAAALTERAGAEGKASRPELLIAMPLHPSRLKERGFNQAAEIARHVSRALHIPLILQGASRIRATTPQVGLPWRQRSGNLRGAFSSSLDLTGRHVAIVDDVMTTGASINELASALRRQGAGEISAWVVARTMER